MYLVQWNSSQEPASLTLDELALNFNNPNQEVAHSENIGDILVSMSQFWLEPTDAISARWAKVGYAFHFPNIGMIGHTYSLNTTRKVCMELSLHGSFSKLLRKGSAFPPIYCTFDHVNKKLHGRIGLKPTNPSRVYTVVRRLT